MHRFTHLIFDLSEVLLTGIKDAGIALREKHALQLGGDHALHSHPSIPTPLLIPLVQELFHGTVDEDAYVAGVLAIYPELGTAETLKRYIRENFREVEGTRAILLKLRKLGYTLALLSVHAKEWVDYCEEKFDYHGLFDVRVYSYEIGASKPDPAAYQHVLSALGVPAQQCIFVDDSPVNTEAAEALGVTSIVFTDASTLHRDLAALLPEYAE